MRIAIFFVTMFFLASCAQQKSIAEGPDHSPNYHRYSTVYEGNRILKYPAKKTVEKSSVAADSAMSYNAAAVVEQAEFQSKSDIGNAANATIPKHTGKPAKAFKFNDVVLERVHKSDRHQQSPDDEAGEVGYVGLMSFLLLIASGVVLFFEIPQVVIISFALALMSFVLSIVGVRQKANQVDFTLAMISLVLNAAGLLILVIYLLSTLV